MKCESTLRRSLCANKNCPIPLSRFVFGSPRRTAELAFIIGGCAQWRLPEKGNNWHGCDAGTAELIIDSIFLSIRTIRIHFCGNFGRINAICHSFGVARSRRTRRRKRAEPAARAKTPSDDDISSLVRVHYQKPAFLISAVLLRPSPVPL